jgi:hypothetical protein
MTLLDIQETMIDAEVEASIFRYAFSDPDGYCYTSGDPYIWYWWRVAPIPDWKLWQLLHPNENPGPYGQPVVCAIAATLSGLTQGGSESGVDFNRRALQAIKYPES